MQIRQSLIIGMVRESLGCYWLCTTGVESRRRPHRTRWYAAAAALQSVPDGYTEDPDQEYSRGPPHEAAVLAEPVAGDSWTARRPAPGGEFGDAGGLTVTVARPDRYDLHGKIAQEWLQAIVGGRAALTSEQLARAAQLKDHLRALRHEMYALLENQP